MRHCSVFIVEVFFFFDVVFTFKVVFIFEVVWIFELVFIFDSMCKLGELCKFLDYSSNVLEISSQLIWNIPVTYWKFPVGSKMILLFLDMFEAFKNSEKNRISLFHVSSPILTIKPSIYKGFSKLERIIIMVLCIFK